MKLSLSYQQLSVIWVTGIALSLISIATIDFYETQQMRSHLERQIDNKVRALTQSLETVERLMYSTKAFLLHGNHPSQQQFEQYLASRADLSTGVQSILWAPLTHQRDLQALKQQALDNGHFGYELTNEPGVVRQSVNSQTFPVLFVAPLFEASQYLGLCLGSDPDTLNTLSLAIEQGHIAVSSYREENTPGVRLFLAVSNSDGKLQGFVVANIILHEFLGVAWQDEINATDTQISVTLDPLTDDRLSEEIFQSHVNTELGGGVFSGRVSHLSTPFFNPLFNQQWRIHVALFDSSGSTIWYSMAIVSLLLLLTACVTMATNFYAKRLQVSDRLIEEKTRSLAIQAIKDSLTNLYNRTALNTEVNKRLSLLKHGQSIGFSILFIDLDRFKVINDSMGHVHGDQLLKLVAQRLIENCRSQGISFRFGGDEFVICLPEQVDRDDLSHICQRYAQVLSQPYQLEETTCHVGASIGISIVTDHQQTLTSILRQADTAMYQAKTASHDKVVFFHSELLKKAEQRFVLEQELAVAMELKQLSLVYQPIYRTSNDAISGFEALLRWHHPTLGQVSPDVFIPVAEETGMIIKIGDWVVKEVAKTLDHYLKNTPDSETVRFNINVSAKQFESDHIYHTLSDVLTHYRFAPYHLGIEITESLLISGSDCSKERLHKLRSLGVAIYLDDFGTGYSSLSVLSDYPVDIVKVDRSFVRDIGGDDARANRLCQAIISMAHTINLQVVAEGVETERQLELLDQFHCNFIQGYLKSKPITACQLERLYPGESTQSALSKRQTIPLAKAVHAPRTTG